MHSEPTNPFTFGDLALDEAFTDRQRELRELVADMRNGQNVLVYAPRRYGKSSLVLRAAQEAVRRKALVAYCDLMRTPTKERFAAALARTIYADLASPVEHALERAADLFRGLRIRPSIEVDPSDATLRFSFQPGRRHGDIDETIERLLERPGELAAERRRRVVIVFDEFQEILALDRRFPNLLRAVFQAQPDVSHVYLGSKRHLLERMFDVTGGHPYATQELAYFTWEQTRPGAEAGVGEVEEALVQVLRSEHNHFVQLWDEAPRPQRLVMLALADEPERSVYSAAYRERHDLPPTPTLQTALAGLTRKEIVGRDDAGAYRLVEPFLAEWLRYEQRRRG